MAKHDLHNIIYTESALNIQAISTNTVTVGNVIDTAGYEAVEFVIFAGNDLDATTVFTPFFEQSDDSTFATGVSTVSSNYLIGTTRISGERPNYDSPSVDPIGDVTFSGLADRNTTGRIGILNAKRYLRLVITTTLKTTGGTIAAIAELGFAHQVPTPRSE